MFFLSFSSSSRRHRLLMQFCLFSAFLTYFVFTHAWYEPSRLILHGQSKAGTPLIQVRWNSGEGFNEYEQRTFRPAIQPLDEQDNNRVTIGATGKQLSASLSERVVCTAIVIDGKQFDLEKLAEYGTYSNGELHFDEKQQASFAVQAKSHIGLRFRTNNHSGKAFIDVNGIGGEHDLYMANIEAKFKQFDHWLLLPDDSFTVEMPLPRYPVHELEILSGDTDQTIQLLSAKLQGKGQTIDLLSGQSTTLGTVRFVDVLEDMKSFFHPAQFCQQIIFALLSAWLLISLFRYYQSVGGTVNIFFTERRYLFWGLFSISLAVFCTWLAAFWPGVMSIDSLKVWRAAMLPDVYLNDHPVLNVFFYKYLYQLCGNPAAVPVVHVILTALLLSWFSFWLFRQGVSIKLVIPCFLFVLCSVPTGVYNLMLWKDIPFALLTVFWACLLVKLYQERRQGDLQWTWQRIFTLLLLGLALGLIRHNGLVYLVVLPMLFLLLRLVPMKKALIGLTALLFVGGISFVVLQSTGKMTDTDFFRNKIENYAGQLSVQDFAGDAQQTMRDYLTVLNINQTAQGWDKFHYYLHDRYAWWFLLHAEWWDLYPYKQEVVQFPKLRKAAMRIYEKSNQEPWVHFAWNPVWLLGLLPVLTLLFWWFPNTAILGAVLLAGALPLVYLKIFNWRYYYFLYLGLLFIPAFVSLDVVCLKKSQIVKKLASAV